LNYGRQSIATCTPGHRLNSGPFGTMGVGLPVRVGAKAARPNAASGPFVLGCRSSDIARGGIERRSRRQQTGARDKAYLQPDAVGIFE